MNAETPRPAIAAPAVSRSPGLRVIQRAALSSSLSSSGGSGALVSPGKAQLARLDGALKVAQDRMIGCANTLRRAGGMLDTDAIQEFIDYYNERRKALRTAVISTEYDSVALANYSRFVTDMSNTAHLIDVARDMAMRRDIVGLARMRSVSKSIKLFVDSAALHRVEHSSGYKEPVTYPKIAVEMSGYRFAGLHGSSSVHGPSLYRGLRAPDPGQLNYATSQLGPGFYLTEGAGSHLDVAYASSVAGLSKGKSGGSAHLYRIMLRNRGAMTTAEVPPQHWNNMEHGTVNPGLAQYAGNDLLTSEIVDNQPARQIKVNAAAFARVMVLPPKFEGSGALDWLKARFRPPGS